MKKLLIIVIGLVLTVNCFSQELNSKRAKDVQIEFLNHPSGFTQYGYIISANFGQGSCDNLSIDADWFFENPNATRNLIGEVQWRDKDRKVFAIQRFYKKNVNYFELPDYGSFKQVEIQLGQLEYLQVVGPVK